MKLFSETLQLDNEDEFIFTSGCNHNAGRLEIFTVGYRGDNFVEVKFLYQCFDHSNNLVGLCVLQMINSVVALACTTIFPAWHRCF